MTTSITWVHIGDLHMDEADGWLSRDRLQAIVAEINTHLVDFTDFVFLPGDNANYATIEQYDAITAALAPLRLPWRVIPGDHDFEPGNLENYKTAIPPSNRPETEVIAAHRCIFLDIVSKGAGGPDFRLSMHHRTRLLEELARADAEGHPSLVFMHAYPAISPPTATPSRRYLPTRGSLLSILATRITAKSSMTGASSMPQPARPARSKRAAAFRDTPLSPSIIG